MRMKSLINEIVDLPNHLPLRVVLIVPLMLLLTGAVGVVGYLSFRNGQRAVNQVANELQNEILHQIKDKLDDYVQVAHNINHLNAIALARGDINPDSAAGETMFWQQNQIFPTASFVYCGNEKGNLVGVGKMTNKTHLQAWVVNDSTNHIPYFYGLDDQGNRNGEFDQDTKPFDARVRPWYKAAKEARRPTWSPIYLGFTTHWPAIATSVPVYDPSGGTLIGACGIDFLLPQEMSQFLKSLNIGKTGSAFIIERSGKLVSTSTAEPIVENTGDKSERLLANQSSNATIRATADFLEQRFDGFDQLQSAQRLAFDIDGARQFVQVVPFQDRYGLDWLIVIVLPEADYLGQIQANIRDTLLLCLLALVAALILSVLTARWITRPVLSLNQSAQAIADGHWHQTVNIKRSDELGKLANSFNQMAQQLQTAFFELQTLNQTLAQNETRLKAFLESLPIGISILDAAGHPYYANQRRLQLIGETIDPTISADQLAELYHLYRAGTDQLYPNEQLPIIQALSGKHTRVDDIEIHQNGQTIPIEVWGTPIFDEQGDVAYAIAAFQDITERKQAENLLTHYNHTLEQQVAERMAALRESEAALRDVYDELRLREQELRLITDAVPVCIFYTDTDERYQFVNQACEDWFGLSRDQFIGKHNHEILGEAAYQMIKPYIDQALGGQLTTYELELSYPADKKYISATYIPDFDPNNQVRGYYGLVIDVSEQRNAALREQKRAEEASILSERNRMAREIHDTLAQSFTGILLQVGAATQVLSDDLETTQSHLDMIEELARTGLAEARRSVTDLRPQLLEGGNLHSALHRLVAQMRVTAHTTLNYELIGTACPLPVEVENNLLRIGQEALTNAIKHANASEICLELVYTATQCCLHIKDNGCGFGVGNVPTVGGFGLLGMNERAEFINAQLVIQSQPGQGTEITVMINCDPEDI